MDFLIQFHNILMIPYLIEKTMFYYLKNLEDLEVAELAFTTFRPYVINFLKKIYKDKLKLGFGLVILRFHYVPHRSKKILEHLTTVTYLLSIGNYSDSGIMYEKRDYHYALFSCVEKKLEYSYGYWEYSLLPSINPSDYDRYKSKIDKISMSRSLCPSKLTRRDIWRKINVSSGDIIIQEDSWGTPSEHKG